MSSAVDSSFVQIKNFFKLSISHFSLTLGIIFFSTGTYNNKIKQTFDGYFRFYITDQPWLWENIQAQKPVELMRPDNNYDNENFICIKTFLL